MYYAKQAINGQKYSAGQKTDHSSSIVTVAGNLEDALAAPIIEGSNASDSSFWCNNK